MSSSRSLARSEPAEADRRSRLGGEAVPYLLLGAITVAGILIRLASYSDSLYGDELSAYFVVTQNGAGRVVDLVQGDQEITPPLYFLLARIAQAVGDPIQSLRWVPMLSGIASIPLTYLLGLRTLGRKAALVAAAIVALSPFLIFYSTEARPYGLMMILCLGSTLALLQAVAGAGRRWWALYALLSCGVMFTHYTGAFVLIGQVAWALAYHRDAWRWLVGSNVAAALAWALPWLSGYRADQDSPGAQLIGLLQPFGFEAFETDVLHWAIGHPIAAFPLSDAPGRPATVLIALGLAVGAVGIVVETARGAIRIRLPREGAALVVALALSAPVIAALYSAASVSVFQPRNLIASSPGLALLLALVVTRPRLRAWWIPATALLVAGFAVAGMRMLAGDSHRPDYEGVAAFVTERGGSAAVTVDAPELSPGPLTGLDVALEPGAAVPSGAGALRLGRPPRAAQLSADQPGGPGQFAPLPSPSPASVARQAVRRAGGGSIFLVDRGDFTFAELRGRRHSGATDQERMRAAFAARSGTAAFARALPSAYRAVEMETFPGFFGYGTLSAIELRRQPER